MQQFAALRIAPPIQEPGSPEKNRPTGRIIGSDLEPVRVGPGTLQTLPREKGSTRGGMVRGLRCSRHPCSETRDPELRSFEV